MSDLDLARRAVACPRWRWMEGMRETTGCRAGLISQDGMVEASTHRGGNDQPRAVVHVVDVGGSNNGWARALPDLDDPATVGCLEALVQRVLGHDGDKIVVHVQWGVGAGYRVMRCRRLSRVSYQGHEVGGCHDTKIAALIAALEAAP